jgi:hypothetical protein
MMKKKNQAVGVTSTITSAQIDECTKLVEQAKAILGTNLVSLSAVDRNRRNKGKRGGETQISVIASLAAANNLSPPQHSAAELQNGYDTIKALKPLIAVISVLLKMVEDSLMQTQSDTWQVATLFYSMLKPLAARDPNVAKALEPVTEFFRPKKTAAKKSGEGTDTTAAKGATVATTASSGTSADHT